MNWHNFYAPALIGLLCGLIWNFEGILIAAWLMGVIQMHSEICVEIVRGR